MPSFASSSHYLVLPALGSQSCSLSCIAWAACLVLAVPSLAAEQAKQPEQVVLEADTLRGEMEGLTVLEGRALLQQGVLSIRSDRLQYDAVRQQAAARGAVKVQRDGDNITGSELQYDLHNRTGMLLQPTFELATRADGISARGSADSLTLMPDDVLQAKEVRYTTCGCAEDGASSAWELRADSMTIDRQANIGYAKGAHLRFYDTPILGVPAVTFPVTDERKSGFLPPTLSLDSVGGLGWKQPYYWNIAPQYDATFTPTLMTRRGLNMGSEFRYLGSNYSGQVQLDVLPSDNLRSEDRWGFAWKQHMDLGMPLQPLTAYDRFTLDAQINRVSDNNYWRDFTDSRWSSRFLANELRLNLDYGRWNASAQALKWQTQQLADSVVEVPYDRLPSLNVSYKKSDGVGWDYQFGSEWVRFKGDEVAREQPNGNRGRLYAEASYLYDRSLWRIRPAVRLDYTRYHLDTPLGADSARTITRVLPTVSLDASMQFERQTTLLGTSYRQTLEPRAFYVYTPFRDQSNIPVYEAAEHTFNFASIFSTRTFTGYDRISDNNLITLGVTSRYLDPQDGSQKLRLAFAQRIRLSRRRVTLPDGVEDKAGWGDMLFGADVQVSDSWNADGVLQYNPERDESDRLALNVSYHPAPYKVFNIGYRFRRDSNEYVDVSWQWPLSDVAHRGNGSADVLNNWYTVGRINYSHLDRKITDSLLGLEYDGQCWVGRVVVQHNQTGESANRRIMAQLEFTGFSSLGTNPLGTLKRNIERYQRIRQVRADGG